MKNAKLCLSRLLSIHCGYKDFQKNWHIIVSDKGINSEKQATCLPI